MKKILILYTSVGLGHKFLAENISLHLEQAGYEVKLYDVLQLQAGALVNISTAIQQFILNRLPFIWKWLYVHSDHGWFSKLTLPNRVKAASRNYRHVKQIVDQFQPDLVITTQTSASAIIQYLKQQGWYKGLFAIAFSDYHLHSYWLYDAADFYLANIDQQKQQMIRLGISAEKIFVLGVTLRPRPEVDIVSVKQKLGINQEDRVVLVASGSLGSGLSATWLVKLGEAIRQLPQTKLIIVCGKNKELEQTLKSRLKSSHVLVQGYYSPMAELYAISDVCLAKPGGLTVAEALQWQLPLLISHFLPGHEELNYQYLTGQGLAIAKPAGVEPRFFVPPIQQELGGRAFRQSLISNPAAVQLTQSGQEGKALTEAVKQAFHNV